MWMLAFGPFVTLQQAEGGGGITKPTMCVDLTICCLCFLQMLGEEDAVILYTVEVKSMSLQSVKDWDNNPV